MLYPSVTAWKGHPLKRVLRFYCVVEKEASDFLIRVRIDLSSAKPNCENVTPWYQSRVCSSAVIVVC